jgi:hypothetical protein
MQVSGNMVVMKVDPARLVVGASNPAGGPQFGLKTVGKHTAHQLPDNPTLLAVAECCRSTGRHADLHAPFFVIRHRIASMDDRACRASGHAPHFSERIAFFEQAQRLTAPRLNHFGRSLGSCQGWVPKEPRLSLLHYFSDGQ